MDKIFKRTLVGAAVAFASAGVMAKQVGINSDFDVDVYGVAAISVVNYDTDETKISTGAVTNKSSGYDYENESRIGFRASKQMFEDVNVLMQIESGYVGENGDGATLGNRDTFIGLDGSWGKVRFGRMLTPMYEIIDWPYANPGLGAAWDWGGDVKYNRDRHGDMARYDSVDYNGFRFALATGRGDKDVEDNYFYGASATYKAADFITFHAAVETESDRQLKEKVDEAWTTCTTAAGCKDADKVDVNYGDRYKSTNAAAATMVDTFGYLIGFEASLPGGFGLAAAYKNGESEDLAAGGKTSEQSSYSIIGQYWNGPWGFKVGYAANEESKTGSVKNDDEDSIISGQIMYVHEGFVPYVRIAQREIKAEGKESDTFVVRVGLEYGF
ncbi:porin [Vibrio panuliri]|uniref:Porin n=1 Tax=Vibrio panuliri TaxID=1381081 RepID=A0A1Q9HML8_9VIBR|nr:porin [Vibrio panuliri]OLQ91945.1 porin [Vibrio panuliri]